MATPRKPRKTLDERIIESAAKVEAEKQELARLQAIQDMAGPRSEWVDELLTEFSIEPQPKDPDEKARLALLRGAMAAPDAGLQQQLDEAKAELDKVAETKSLFWKLLNLVAGDLGLKGGDSTETLANVRARYNV